MIPIVSVVLEPEGDESMEETEFRLPVSDSDDPVDFIDPVDQLVWSDN